MSVARGALQSLTLYQPDKTYNGFTLFTPMTGSPSNTWLMDMQGRFVHRWKLAGWIRLQAELLPTGNLLYGIWNPEGAFAVMPFAGGEVIEADWDGNIVWRYDDPHMDGHDRVRMKNGNTLIQKYVSLPKDMAAKVKGGTRRSEGEEDMWSACLQEITPDRKVAWEWRAYEHLDPELDSLSPLSHRWDWPTFNSLVELPDGNIMTCSPSTDNITIIDKATGDVKWRWGKGIISFPHNPSMLDNGNVLVFDNGRYGPSPHHSRVIEVNPTGEIEWEYKAENPVDFYSNYMGGCDRLPNGNTLICEASRGRLFEVTPSGQIVWEYVVPFHARHGVPGWEGIHIGLSNSVFRAHRYGPDYPGLQGKKLNPKKLDLWNRLYGPEAFGLWGRPSWGGMLRAPVIEEREPLEKIEPEAKEEPKPSVAKPGAKGPGAAKEEKRVRSRLDRLGY